MDCKEFERLIPDFVSDKLDYQTLKRFHSHMESCESCREELTIQFLVIEGIQRLEDGKAFDLKKELEQRVEESRKRIRAHEALMRVGLALEIAAVGALICFAVWILL